MNTVTKVLCFGVCFGTLLTAADPIEGTWKLNLSKSKYVVTPPPKGFTIVIRAAGNGRFEHKIDGVASDGQKISLVYTASRDGAEAAIVGDARYDTIRIRSIDNRTEEALSTRTASIFASTGTPLAPTVVSGRCLRGTPTRLSETQRFTISSPSSSCHLAGV